MEQPVGTFYEVWARTVAISQVRHEETGKLLVKKAYVERFWKGPFETQEGAEREAARLGERWGHLFIVKEFGHDASGTVSESECGVPAGGTERKRQGNEVDQDDERDQSGHLIF